MIDRPNWWAEGALARDWERKLKPVLPRPVKKVRRWSPFARSVYTVIGLWAAGMVATLLAVQVVVMSYRVDALQSHYTALVRQEEQLQQRAAAMAAPTTVVADAQKLHVTLAEAPPALPKVTGQTSTVSSADWLQRLDTLVAGLRRALIGR
ncbi:MAG: hypothetical protein K6U14_09210 [Firmicutes bacterium]|nr:hypothetical protein [Alicyclobacillaceae bacterium]MCL6497790.1 hypothetical protein [Bacillota bacterium]